MAANIIDGKKISATLKKDIADKVKKDILSAFEKGRAGNVDIFQAKQALKRKEPRFVSAYLDDLLDRVVLDVNVKIKET